MACGLPRALFTGKPCVLCQGSDGVEREGFCLEAGKKLESRAESLVSTAIVW